MTPPVALADVEPDSLVDIVPPTKKAKLDHDRDEPSTVVRHPLGVRPAGNALFADRDLRVSIGTFRRLPEELLAMLLAYLKPADLLRLGGTCRALFAYTRNDELWRAHFTE